MIEQQPEILTQRWLETLENFVGVLLERVRAEKVRPAWFETAVARTSVYARFAKCLAAFAAVHLLSGAATVLGACPPEKSSVKLADVVTELTGRHVGLPKELEEAFAVDETILRQAHVTEIGMIFFSKLNGACKLLN